MEMVARNELRINKKTQINLQQYSNRG